MLAGDSERSASTSFFLSKITPWSASVSVALCALVRRRFPEEMECTAGLEQAVRAENEREEKARERAPSRPPRSSANSNSTSPPSLVRNSELAIRLPAVGSVAQQLTGLTPPCALHVELYRLAYSERFARRRSREETRRRARQPASRDRRDVGTAVQCEELSARHAPGRKNGEACPPFVSSPSCSDPQSNPVLLVTWELGAG
jgi:hypothetical protein